MQTLTNKRVALRFLLLLLVSGISSQYNPSKAQKWSVSAYAGLEGERIITTQNILVNDLIVDGQATANIDLTYGVQLNYRVTDKTQLSSDFNIRLPYRYAYFIYHPVPDRFPIASGLKIGDIGCEELSLLLGIETRLLSIGTVNINGMLSGGISFMREDNDNAVDIDFGPELASTTDLFRTLSRVEHKNVLIAAPELNADWRRFSIRLRYINTLSRSITDPFMFEDTSYPYVNKRDGLQLLVGYTLPIGG